MNRLKLTRFLQPTAPRERGDAWATLSMILSLVSLFGLGHTIIALHIVAVSVVATAGVGLGILSLVTLPPSRRFTGWLALSFALAAMSAAALVIAAFAPCGSRCF